MKLRRKGDVGLTSSGEVMRNKKRMDIALVGLLVVAFILRLGWMFYARPEPVSDFEEYRQLAASLLDHHQYGYPEPEAFRTPGYPVFLAGLMLISRSVFWLSFMNVALSTLACALLYLVAYKLFGRKDIALTAALVCALNPAFVFFSPVLASEHLLSSLVLGATLLALTEGGRSYLLALLTGLMLGAAALTRGEALFYIPIVLGISLWWPQSIVATLQRRILAASLVAIGAACLLLPWYVRNTVVIGKGAGLATSSGYIFYAKHHPKGDKPIGDLPLAERNKKRFRLGIEYIKTMPKSLLRGVMKDTFKLYAPSASLVVWSTRLPRKPGADWISKPLVLLALAKHLEPAGYSFLLSCVFLSLFTIRSWPRRAAWVLGAFVFQNWFFYAVIFVGNQRYRYFLEFLFCICVGIVLVRLVASKTGESIQLEGWSRIPTPA